MKLAMTVVTLVLLAACQDRASTDSTRPSRESPASVCVKENAQCVFSEGKIGLCTARPGGCDAGETTCLVCMSLH